MIVSGLALAGFHCVAHHRRHRIGRGPSRCPVSAIAVTDVQRKYIRVNASGVVFWSL